MTAAVDAYKKLLKIRKGLKHTQLHFILFTKFKEARLRLKGTAWISTGCDLKQE